MKKIGKWEITGKDAVWFIVCLILVIIGLGALLLSSHTGAMNVISGASTLVSIVLSVVAILYTMIEGADSSRVNEATIDRLSNIEKKISELNEKSVAQASVRNEMKEILSDMMQQAKLNKENSEHIGTTEKNPEVLDELHRLKKVLDDDIEE